MLAGLTDPLNAQYVQGFSAYFPDKNTLPEIALGQLRLDTIWCESG